jgi:hypothetical protein
MAKKIRDTSPKPPRIIDTSAKPERLDPAIVAAALGAELVGRREPGGSPVSVFAKRQGMYRSLKTVPPVVAAANGEKPSEIVLSEHDWETLQLLAALLAEKGFTASVGQIAAALLKMTLATYKHVDEQAFQAALQRELAAASSAD